MRRLRPSDYAAAVAIALLAGEPDSLPLPPYLLAAPVSSPLGYSNSSRPAVAIEMAPAAGQPGSAPPPLHRSLPLASFSSSLCAEQARGAHLASSRAAVEIQPSPNASGASSARGPGSVPPPRRRCPAHSASMPQLYLTAPFSVVWTLGLTTCHQLAAPVPQPPRHACLLASVVRREEPQLRQLRSLQQPLPPPFRPLRRLLRLG